MATLALDYTIISNPAGVYGGSNQTSVTKINNHSEVVGNYINANGEVIGFYLNNGSYTDIGENRTDVLGLNDLGDLVGWSQTIFTGAVAFVYSNGDFDEFTLPGPAFALAQDINDAGTIVGLVNYDDGTGYHSFIASSGGVTTFDAPDAATYERAEGTIALGVNELSQVVGYYESDTGVHGFLYDGGTFTALDVPGSLYTIATDINEWGQISGYYAGVNGAAHGFVFDNGTYYTIEAPSGVGAVPGTVTVSGINDLGQIAGDYVIDGFNGTEGFVATLGMEFTYDVDFFDHPDAVPSAGGPPSFGTEIRNSNVDGDFVGRYSDSSAPGFQGQSFINIGGAVFDLAFVDATGGVAATDINDLGQVVGAYRVSEDGSSHGFIYDAGTYVTLDSTLGDAGTTELLGMNNVGQIIGTYTDGGAEHAFIYDSTNGFVELDLSGAGAPGNDIFALDINDYGQVVGTYIGAGGVAHGFLLDGGLFTTIAVPGAAGFGSGGVSINNAGQIAGVYMDSSFVFHAFVYSGGVYSTVDMPNPGGAYGISNNGTVAGSDNDGTTHHGFLAEISGATLVPILAPEVAVVGWDRPVDGNFEDATKWRGGAVPGELDKAVITWAGEFTVTLTSDITVDKLAVGTFDPDDDGGTLRIVDAALRVNGGSIVVPGTVELDSNSGEGAALLIGADTAIVGGCGCDPDIVMGMTDPVGPIRIGAADDVTGVVKLTNVSGYIAGQGQIGDAMTRFVNAGIVEAMGGTLVLDTGANRIGNGGELSAGPDSTLDVNSELVNFSEIVAFGDPSGSPAGGGEINLNAFVKNFGLILAEEDGSINANGTLWNFAAINVESSFTASGPVLNDEFGTIQASGSGLIDITGDVINRGLIEADDFSTILLHGAVNNSVGQLVADGGSIVVGSTKGAVGTASIIDGGSLEFQGVGGAYVDFSGDEGGKLILDDATIFKGDITGFDDTDMIQFKDLLFGSDVEFRYFQASGVLKIFEDGVLDAKLKLIGSYSQSDFQIVDDGTGHVAIQHFEPPII